MVALQQYDWILAITTIAFCGSSFGNGANDVANAYATSVAARSLTMPQVGFLSMITEFVGAVALGARVTGTIKNNIIDLNHYTPSPGVLMLVMSCAEVASAFWLLLATKLGFPVSTTQTVVGALVGAGIASQASVSWSWASGGVSQIAASWAIAPLISAAFSAILFGTLKFCVLERQNSFEKALRAIPVYLAFTGAVLALFITVEAPTAPSLEDLGAGTAVGIVLGAFFGVLLIAYVFFVPYFHRVVVKNEPRMRPWHIPLGPLLYRENPPLYFPGKGDSIVVDYYQSAHGGADTPDDETLAKPRKEKHQSPGSEDHNTATGSDNGTQTDNATTTGSQNLTGLEELERGENTSLRRRKRVRHVEPEERWLVPVQQLPLYHPRRVTNCLKYFFLQGVTRDCVTHASQALADVHMKAKRYDNRIEHLWTYAQVASAMMMSIAHGSNDVANAVGPWVAVYQTFRTGVVSEDSATPIWILVAAGFLLGAGFWFMGHHIIKALGNKITQLSPTRGYAMELGAAITVLLASRLGLPVSTTQCLTGAVVGVALMNGDLGAVNWKQLGWIFGGWVLTLPSAGLISGLLTLMALNAPQF
ncbi:phosphate transporter [Fusarium flagelliforme]|uniref:Phosphate transporter n=1 Tax=Fusarium flagelliforme TaxID=2675880 RepID=A0A395M9J2_9HYPO|nr:phosphate transporter [Fusarium flagelliforme]KAH7179960.1 phosphate transporter [Fusarium flagelliforme]RFN44506.1 phosphate transporter [Fusarium flagelliforme]